MALFKGSKENKFSLMAQTNIVFTQGNLGIKREEETVSCRELRKALLLEPLLLSLVTMSATGRHGNHQQTVFCDMKGAPGVRCLSWVYPQEEASLTTLNNNRLRWWVAHP